MGNFRRKEMIEKERLEELIREETIIYYIWYTKYAPYMRISECKLNNKMYVDDDILCLEDCDDGEILYLNDIFETKEELDWHIEFGCIERTERLELPTWEEFWNSGQTIWFTGKDGGQYGLSQYNREILLNDAYIGYLDKESYYKACRKCKEIFLGENK